MENTTKKRIVNRVRTIKNIKKVANQKANLNFNEKAFDKRCLDIDFVIRVAKSIKAEIVYK